MQKCVGTAISTYEDRQRAEARSKAEAFARELDYSLADLFSAEVKATLASAPAKHRHPKNTTVVWFSRGVSVRSDCPACVMEWVIVSTMGSGHFEVGDGGEERTEEAGLV